MFTRIAGWISTAVFTAIGIAGAPAVGVVGMGMTVAAVAAKSILREVPHS